MSLPPPPKGPSDHDKIELPEYEAPPSPGFSAIKSGADQDSHLNVTFSGGIRAPSPALSLISLEDFEHDESRSPLGAPLPPRTLKGKVAAFWKNNKGLALVLLSQVFGTLMNVTTRLLEIEGNNGRGYHPFQILFARMGITVILSSLYMWHKKTEHFPFGMREVRPLLVARGLLGFFGVFGIYYSLLYLPLSDATVITFLAPSLACWACSYLIHEPFTRMEQIAAYISLFGVVLIARPLSLLSHKNATESPVSPPDASGGTDSILPMPGNGTIGGGGTGLEDHRFAADYDKVTPAQRAAAVGIAMIGVLGAAGAYTTIRWIGKRAHPLISVNYFATWCTIVSIVMMFALKDVGFLLPSGIKDWSYLVFLGICGFVMQFLLAAGLQYEKSSRATNMVYTQMLFALAFDKLVFGTTPDYLSIIGSSLILGSAIYVAMHKEVPVKKEVVGDGEEERGLMGDDMERIEATDLSIARSTCI
ncbi:hypothetical protein P154DRAFT_552953 [Amniculicola lignicola CBS 123094]|uniref:EamA domain-containing protein n=1 Tax=Amniculicola lignicola CBS 123094 TaxID=1392246 RepID=A0A6A5WNP3_9PLEO|nr:hypothetical protein P154DRAFT_552953 [Amniculicola lignicola CBS 123094]